MIMQFHVWRDVMSEEWARKLMVTCAGNGLSDSDVLVFVEEMT